MLLKKRAGFWSPTTPVVARLNVQLLYLSVIIIYVQQTFMKPSDICCLGY